MARYISQGQARRSLMLRRPARVAKASGSTSRRPEPRRTEVVVFGPCAADVPSTPSRSRRSRQNRHRQPARDTEMEAGR
jgi:hypothetical protein